MRVCNVYSTVRSVLSRLWSQLDSDNSLPSQHTVSAGHTQHRRFPRTSARQALDRDYNDACIISKQGKGDGERLSLVLGPYSPASAEQIIRIDFPAHRAPLLSHTALVGVWSRAGAEDDGSRAAGCARVGPARRFWVRRETAERLSELELGQGAARWRAR